MDRLQSPNQIRTGRNVAASRAPVKHSRGTRYAAGLWHLRCPVAAFRWAQELGAQQSRRTQGQWSASVASWLSAGVPRSDGGGPGFLTEERRVPGTEARRRQPARAALQASTGGACGKCASPHVLRLFEICQRHGVARPGTHTALSRLGRRTLGSHPQDSRAQRRFETPAEAARRSKGPASQVGSPSIRRASRTTPPG